MRKNKPIILVNGSPWALQRLGLQYVREVFGVMGAVERFFRYLKEKTVIFYHKLSAGNYYQGLMDLRMFICCFQYTRYS